MKDYKVFVNGECISVCRDNFDTYTRVHVATRRALRAIGKKVTTDVKTRVRPSGIKVEEFYIIAE